MYECKLHMNNILFVQIMQVKAKNNRQFNRKVGFLHLTTLLHSNYWGWGLKGTLKKGLYHTQSFSAYSLLVFPVLLSRNSVLKRSQILSLWPQTCTTFSQHHIPALKNWGKKVTHTQKNFSRGKSRQLQQQNAMPTIFSRQFQESENCTIPQKRN